MIPLHHKLSWRSVLVCLSLLFFLHCSTGPEFEMPLGSPEIPAPSASSAFQYSSFGGWRGASTSEHFVLTGLDTNSMTSQNVGGDAYNLSPESGFSAYFH